MEVAGYKDLAELFGEPTRVLYRARSAVDGSPVTLVVPKPATDHVAFREHFLRDHEISSSLDAKGVVKTLRVEEHDPGPVLVLEAFGVPLAKVLGETTLPMGALISLAFEAAEILTELHDLSIVHQRVMTSNFFYAEESGVLKIAGLSLASVATGAPAPAADSNSLQCMLPYMSPEQTNRINHTTDYRTDFYSLGVSLYEWFTGTLPFVSDDPMELVHDHIAVRPTRPSEVAPLMPAAVSSIIMKLLAKAPEERYQSGRGLLADLGICKERFGVGGYVDEFPLGQSDRSAKLHIPAKVYGRHNETQLLLATFDRASHGGLEVLMVAGYSGIGKSALVNRIRNPIAKRSGFFISGKYDQLSRNIAYSAITRAFRELLSMVMAESPERVEKWRTALLSALGQAGQVIIELVPEVELLIGKQPPACELGPVETHNRLNILFQDFVRVFAQEDHPLAIFLDDLQWADFSSLGLIKLLATDPDTSNLFLIGAYRDNEVDESHPAIVAFKEIEESGIPVTTITLPPLSQASINRLIAESLSIAEEQAGPLTEIIYQKTGGNPLFTKAFLLSLCEEEILQFDPCAGWQWEADDIGKMEATENVVRLMTQRIRAFPRQTGELLKMASCLGNTFNVEYLTIITGKTREQIISIVQAALDAGMVLVHSETTYRFVHDRIQEAAYQLIPSNRKEQTHLEVGRRLLEASDETQLAERLFVVVEQLNAGRTALSSDSEKLELARLNLTAARRSRNSAAFEAMLSHLNIATELLPADRWRSEPELTYELYVEKAEAEYLNTNFRNASDLFDLILSKTEAPLKRTRIYETKIDLLTAENRLLEAIDVGLEALRVLEVEVDENASFRDEMHHIMELVQATEIDALVNLPRATDPRIVAAMRILMHTWTPAYIGNPKMAPLVVAKMANLSMEYGHSRNAPLVYCLFGAFIAGRLMEFDAAYRFGALGQKLLERFETNHLECRVLFNLAVFINPWKQDMTIGLDYLKRGFRSGLRSGDLQFASYSINHFHITSILAGKQLAELEASFNEHRPLMRKAQQVDAIEYYNMFNQLVLNLQGKTGHAPSLTGPGFDEEEITRNWIEVNNMNTLSSLYIVKMMLHYLYEDHVGALACARKSEECVDGTSGMVLNVAHSFFYVLTLAGVFETMSEREQRECLPRIATHREKLRIWAEHCPLNFKCKHLLAEAISQELITPNVSNGQLLNDANEAAAASKNMFDEALTNELSGRFWLNWDNHEMAAICMTRARDAYGKWGAERKVSVLVATYRGLFTSEPAGENAGRALGHSVSADSLDLLTVIKASQAISGEMTLDTLITKLMNIIIENAGAQSGVLLLEKHGVLRVEAEVQDERVEVLRGVPVEDYDDLPRSLVLQVFRSGKEVVLADASGNAPFAGDPYALRTRPKSCLCMQIRYQNRPTGVLYLENNLMVGAFTDKHLTILDVLLAQASISIENARLFQEREEALTSLTKSEGKFRGLVESSSDFIWEVDVDGVYTYASPQIEVILGRSPAEIVGKTPFDLMPPQEAERIGLIFREIAAAAIPIFALENINLHRDGRRVVLETNGLPVYDAEGTLIGYRGIDRDITDRKATEEALRSEKAFTEAALNALQDTFFLFEPGAGKAIRWNKAFTDISGYTDEEVARLPAPTSYYSERDVAKASALVQRIIKAGEGTIELELICKDGRKVPTEYKVATIGNGVDGPLYLISVGRDITERKQAEQELRHLRNYLSNIIDSMPSLLVGVDAKGFVTQWNREAERITGLSPKEATGRPFGQVIPRLAEEMEHVQQAMATRKVHSDPRRPRKEDGKTKYEDVTVFPLIANGVQGAVIRVDDVTQECELEAQLHQSRKMDAIGKLAGGIAHDFNNMLAGIISAAELLGTRKVNLNANGIRYADLIIKSATRAAELTAKLLAFSRKRENESKVVDMDAILDDALAILRNTIDKRVEISLEKEAQSNTILGDYAALQNVLINLGINASHAMPDGGELRISAKNLHLSPAYCATSPFAIEPGEYIAIEVRDTGCGIDPDDLKMIFEPFFTTKKLGEGTGLGLAAVYGTVQDHHGAITVYSEVGEGTVFHLYLPTLEGGGDEPPPNGEVVSGTGTVLLVDDEEALRVAGEGLLEEMGYRVLTACDGDEAVEVFRKHHEEIDIVIMDMVMPIMNGYEAFFEMRKIDEHCTVVIASGFTKEDHLEEMQDAGLAGFIQKPYRTAEFSQLLAQLRSN